MVIVIVNNKINIYKQVKTILKKIIQNKIKKFSVKRPIKKKKLIISKINIFLIYFLIKIKLNFR